LHIYILGPKLLLWNFLQTSQLTIEVVRTNFSADFWTFRIFWQKIRENCGAT